MKAKLVGLLVLLLIGVAACKYDDDALWDKLNSLEERIASLEDKLSQMNSDIRSMSTIVDALESKISISKVEETENGYKITFTNDKEIVLKNGEDGKNGKDAPTISIDKEDGEYYWVQIIDGKKSWLTDEKGNKIPVTGKGAVTPILKVSAKGYWLISYDRGVTYKEILDENGKPVKAVGKDGEDGTDGTNGSDGSFFFKEVKVDEENSELVLTLKDGMELRVPIANKTEEGESYILNENVVRLTSNDEKKYIQALIPDQSETSDKNTIVYALNTPKDKLPKKGEVLLYNEVSEIFPSGFLGKVTKVEEKDGMIQVQTEPVALNEAFDKLYLDQTFDLEPALFSRSSIEQDEEGFWTYEFPVSLRTGSDEAGASMTGLLKSGYKLYVHIEIDEIANKSPWVMITLQTKGNLSFETKLYAKGEKELLKLPIGPEFTFRSIPAAIVLTPAIQLYGTVKVEGLVNLTSNWSHMQRNIAGVEYKDRQWRIGSNELKSQNEPFIVSVNPEANLSLEGTLFGGVETELKLKLFNNKNMKIAIEPKIGVYEKSNFSLDLTNPNFYESVKDSKVSAGIRLGLDAEAEANIIQEGDAKWKSTLLEQDFEFLSSYLFPSFESDNVKVENKEKKVTVSYNVDNNLMFPSNIGVSLYEEDKKVKDSSPENYVFEADYDNPLIAIFDNLKGDVQYTVNPYVKWGDWIIPATPSHSFKLEKEDEEEPNPDLDPSETIVVTTGTVSGLQKDATILSGSVKGISISETSSYGFIYTQNGIPSADNGIIVNSSEFSDGQFSVTISGLDEGINYYWCAFVEKDGTYYYGIANNFMINKPITEEVKNILVELYDATDGDNWNNRENWKTEQPVETWYGVSVKNGLISLDLSNNNLTGGFSEMKNCADFLEIDLSGNNISYFHVENMGKLAKIDISNCHLLEYFSVSSSDNLSELSLLGCSSLISVQIDTKKLKDLDFSQCINIQNLDAWDGELENLNLKNCSQLKKLNVQNNSIFQLDLSDCVNLEELSCWKNAIKELDLTQCTKLRKVDCFENQITVLSLNAPNTLERLSCTNNAFTSLSVKGYTSLSSLDVQKNRLVNIDFTNCPVLEEVIVNFNELTSLDITGCSNLRTLYCNNNKINSEIPIEFDNIIRFIHDPKYSYGFDNKGDPVILETKEYGWWYPGEPGSRQHKR